MEGVSDLPHQFESINKGDEPFLEKELAYQQSDEDVDWAEIWKALGAEPDLDQLPIVEMEPSSYEVLNGSQSPSDIDSCEYIPKSIAPNSTNSANLSRTLTRFKSMDVIYQKFSSSTLSDMSQSDISQDFYLDWNSETCYRDDELSMNSPLHSLQPSFESSPHHYRSRSTNHVQETNSENTLSKEMPIIHQLRSGSPSTHSNNVRSLPTSPARVHGFRTGHYILSSGMHVRNHSDYPDLPQFSSSPNLSEEVPSVLWGSSIAMESELRTRRRRASQLKSILSQDNMRSCT